ncbi:hypothetical protein MNBD_BACTEROID03-1575 [hydrothermal vent metagenome]|uniref:Lipocalin-like domain-containing protein n=1 Tax=hydrothermal vent metagenome TaxID=652676 RepID=A0A3B0SV96_9ZZZZ
MKKGLGILVLFFLFIACGERKENLTTIVDNDRSSTELVGTWKLVYGDVLENDSLTVKDVSTSDFIKIINRSHFAFFNQRRDTGKDFYGGAGTYTLEGNTYKETLNYTSVDEIRGHEFPFTIEIKGDTLVQRGLEQIKEAGIERYIVEKYIRIE